MGYLQRFSRYWPLKIFCRVIFAKNRSFPSPERPEKCVRLQKCIYQVPRVAAWTYQQQKADWPIRCYGNQAKMADFWPKITENDIFAHSIKLIGDSASANGHKMYSCSSSTILQNFVMVTLTVAMATLKICIFQ